MKGVLVEHAEQHNDEEQQQRDESPYVVALGDVHDRGVESLCVGEAA